MFEHFDEISLANNIVFIFVTISLLQEFNVDQ